MLQDEQLTPGQKRALRWATETSRNLFVTGFAGTGKTSILARIVYDLRKRGDRVRATAFTGLAAQKLGGVTLSRLLGAGLSRNKQALRYLSPKKAAQNLDGVKHLIIDEISMLSGDFLEMVDLIMQKAMDNKEPFGGVRIIFSGDFMQLPPIHRKIDPAPKMQWAFQYPPFCQAKGIVLQKSLRQEDEYSVYLLNQFRQGIVSVEGREFLDQAVGRRLVHPARIFCRNKDVQAMNHRCLESLPGEAYSYPTECRPRAYQETLLAQVPIDTEVVLKKKAPVIILANCPHDTYANGSQGMLTELKDDSVIVKLIGGDEVKVPYKTWEIVGSDRRSMGMVEGLPLQLGWAATIHRAQGLTLSRVQADIADCWEPGQAYVALSRTTSLANLSLVRPVEHIRVSTEALEFVNSLQ